MDFRPIFEFDNAIDQTSFVAINEVFNDEQLTWINNLKELYPFQTATTVGSSLVVYTNNKTKVEIVCPSHKSFQQTPHNHLAGHGCPLCALKEKSLSQSKILSDVIDQFNIIHNFKYEYDKVNYINNKTVDL